MNAQMSSILNINGELNKTEINSVL